MEEELQPDAEEFQLLNGEIKPMEEREMMEEGTLFDAVTKTVSCIIQYQKDGRDFSQFLTESVQYIQDIEMKLSFPEQQSAGAAVVMSAKFLLPSTSTPDKLTLLPLFHQALDMIGSFDKLSNFHWSHVQPLFQQYLEAIPKDAPSATKVLQFLIRMFDILKISKIVTKDFFSLSNVLISSRVISVTLEIIKNVDQDLAVRKLAIEVLGRIIIQCPPEHSGSIELVVAGLLSGLLRVAKGSSVNIILLQETLNLFGKTMVLVFGNNSSRFDRSKINFDDLNPILLPIFDSHNEEWEKMAISTIHDYVKTFLSNHLGHRLQDVKRQVCEMICLIQLECGNFLGESLYDCILFMYLHFRYDDHYAYRELAERCLELVQDPLLVEQYLYKQLEDIVQKLPTETRAYRGGPLIQTLAAVLDGLGDAVTMMCTTSSSTIEELIRCLADCIEVDKQGLLITSGKIAKDLNEELAKFKLHHLLEHKAVQIVCEVLVGLGKMEVIHIVHSLMMEESPGRQVSYHIMLAYMLNGLETHLDMIDDSVILMLAEYLVNELNSACTIEVREDASPVTFSSEHNWNSCIECLTCTNVALCMKFIEGTCHRSNVSVNCLCAILTQTVSSTWIVAESACFALTLMVANDDYVDSLTNLIYAYSSHVLNTISLACTSSEDYLRAPQMLLGYMRYAEINENFDQFQVIIEKMLHALDNNEQKFTHSLMQAILGFMTALNMRYENLRPIEPPEESENQKDLPTPQHMLTEKVLLRTKHMLTSPHISIKVASIGILVEGMELLKYYDDMLLPMIHQNWHGIMTIIKSGEPLVMIEAFEAVSIMAEKSGTFVHSKVIKEFWPPLKAYLVRCILKPDMYHHTADYRLSIHVIGKIAELVINLRLDEKEANETLVSLLNFAIEQQKNFVSYCSEQKLKVENHFKDLTAAGGK